MARCEIIGLPAKEKGVVSEGGRGADPSGTVRIWDKRKTILRTIRDEARPI